MQQDGIPAAGALTWPTPPTPPRAAHRKQAQRPDPHAILRAATPYLPAVLGLVTGLLILGPGLGRGYLLRVDMVAVPDPPLKGALLGFSSAAPRAVPSDLVLTVLGHLVPADLAQKLLLLGALVIASAGVGALMRPFPLPARLAACFFYVWNPYVAERLLVGHWALLYGYASLPWIVRAVRGVSGVRERVSWRRVSLALLPAAVGGFAAMLVAGTVLAGACMVRRSWRAVGIGAAVWLLCSLPWLLPSLANAHELEGDPAGADAFAARGDTPLGAFGSLLMLGGIWNRDSVPEHYADAPLLAVRILLTGLALAGVAILCTEGRLRSRRGAAVLVLPTLLGLLVAALTTVKPGQAALRAAIRALPSAGAVRDAQQFVAPLALLEAVGLGVLVTALLSAGRLKQQGALGYAGAALLLPLLALPQLGWGVGGALRPVRYPDEWAAVRHIVDGDPAPGAVLVLPWSAYRAYPWNPSGPLLDPATKSFGRRVIADDSVMVGDTVIGGEDLLARRAERSLAADGWRPTPADCAALGVRYVLVESLTGSWQTLDLITRYRGTGLILYQCPAL